MKRQKMKRIKRVQEKLKERRHVKEHKHEKTMD